MQPDRPQPPLTRASAPTAFALRNIADRKARGRLRAAATAEAIGRELEWTDAEGWRYQFEAPPVVTISEKDTERAAATVDLKVWDAAGDLIFRDRVHAWDGFPVLVPDGSQHKETLDDGTTQRVDNFREAPLEAARLDLAHTVRVVVKDGPWVKAHPGTVSTFYATAPGGASSERSGSATYATARTGGTLAAQDPHRVGQLLDTGSYICYESFLIFDTSGIPDGDTVEAVTLSLDGNTDQSTTDFIAGVAASAYDGGVVAAGDWVSGASIPTPELATWNSSGYSATYNDFTETADFKAAISKTGNTSLMLYSQRHRDATTPTGHEGVIFEDADTAGTTSDPKLVVTHAAASVPFRRALLGVGF